MYPFYYKILLSGKLSYIYCLVVVRFANLNIKLVSYSGPATLPWPSHVGATFSLSAYFRVAWLPELCLGEGPYGARKEVILGRVLVSRYIDHPGSDGSVSNLQILRKLFRATRLQRGLQATRDITGE